MDDARAIEAVLTGDTDRYRDLVERHKKMVYAIAWSQLGDSELSEDAAQDTFIKAYSYLRTLRDPSLFGSWIARITRNICANLRRKVSRETAFVSDLAVQHSARESAPPSAEHDGIDADLWSSFAALPNTYREALTVFYIEGKSVEESAKVLGIGESAMKTRLHRGRIALRERLEASLEDALENLQPSNRFTNSVMSVLPLSQGGLLGAGGIAGVLAKLSAGLWLALWPVLVQAAIIAGLMRWFTDSETLAIKDTPEKRIHRSLVWQNAIPKWIGMTAAIVCAPFLLHSFGLRPLFRVLAIFCVLQLWPMLRLLRVNRTRLYWAMASQSVLLATGSVGVGFFDLPLYIYIFLQLPVTSALAFFGLKDAPRRRDFNLFLRCVIGGIKSPEGCDASLPRRLTDREMRVFVRFLGDQRLVTDYKLVGDTLVMVLPRVRSKFAELFNPFGGSTVAITRMGTCNAIISPADLAAIRRVTGRIVDPDRVQTDVAEAVQAALASFSQNDVVSARSILTTQAEATIFDPKDADYYWTALAFAILATMIALAFMYF